MLPPSQIIGGGAACPPPPLPTPMLPPSSWFFSVFTFLFYNQYAMLTFSYRSILTRKEIQASAQQTDSDTNVKRRQISKLC